MYMSVFSYIHIDEISLCLDTHCSEKNCDARILLPLYPPDVGHGACVKPQKLDDHPMADLMFAGKVRDIWNTLPEDVIHCDTVDDFREALIKLRMKDPDCYKYEFTTYHHNSHRPKSSHPVNRQQDRYVVIQFNGILGSVFLCLTNIRKFVLV